MSSGSRELDGQVALVTGSAKNIGRAINLALADAGAKVVINALTSRLEAEQLAHELAPNGVTANAISPGMIDTVRGATAGEIPASIAAADNLLGRKGRPEEIAAMVRSLCGPAGRYVTGQTICVNGGMHF